LFLFLLRKREDGRIGGLRTHADRMQILVLGYASSQFDTHIYVFALGAIANLGRRKVPGSFPIPPSASGGMSVYVASVRGGYA
jgi:hypothetical protein